MEHSSGMIENLVRCSAMLMLAGYVLGYDSTAGVGLLCIALCAIPAILLSLSKKIRKGELVQSVMKPGKDIFFWPAFIILWCAVAYSKSVSIVPHLVLLAVAVLIGSAQLYLNWRILGKRREK